MCVNKLLNLSKENKNLIANMLGSLIVRGLGLVISFFSMPAYMRFFNDDVALGIWFTILSILNWVLYFDFGVGNGLRNCLSKSLAVDDTDKSKKYTSSAYLSIGLFCFFGIFIFLIISKFLSWHKILGIQGNSVSEIALYKTVCIVFTGIIMQMFFRLISSVLYAIQKSAVNNFLSLITSVIQVASLYLFPSRSNDLNLITMALIHVFAVVFPMLITTFILFSNKRYRAISPSFKYFDRNCSKEVLSLGGGFLIAQLLYMVIMNTNEYLIALFVGNEAVVDYQVYYKLYTLASTLFVMLLTPLWSAVTKALAERRCEWIKSLYQKALLFALICSLLVALIPIVAQPFVDLWLGNESIKMDFIYGMVFSALSTSIIFNNVFSVFSNGIGNLKVQIICFTIGAALKIPLAYFMVSLTSSWIGVVISNIAMLALYCCVQPFYVKQYFTVKE